MKQPINITILLFSMLLVGCSTSPRHPTIPRPPGYRCKAVNKRNGGRSGVSWSKSKHIARSHALKHCRVRSRYPGACRIKFCVRTGLAASKYWYTCYVKNRGCGGVWSSTSHSRFTSTSHAFARCRRLSGMPASCYFRYCRVW